MLGMKPMGSGVILKSKTATPIECLHYAHEPADLVVITGIDSMEILDQAFEAARSLKTLDEKRRPTNFCRKTRTPPLTANFGIFSRPATVLQVDRATSGMAGLTD